MIKKPLPTELGLLAIDHIGTDADKNYCGLWAATYLQTLCICTLVCKDWIRRSRSYLLRSIYIQDKAGLDALQRTFSDNPSFRYLVYAIHVTPPAPDGDDREPPVLLHRALLLLRTMPSCTVKLGVSVNVPLDNITRRCLSLSYPHIVHLHLDSIDAPINRVHYLINAFPSLRTLSYSAGRADEAMESCCSKYSIAHGRRRSPLTGRDIFAYGKQKVHISDEGRPYIAHSLRHNLEYIKLREEDWVEEDGDILNLSKFPLLHSLALHLPYRAFLVSLETVVKLLTHRKPCPPLQTISLIFDSVFSFIPPNHRENVQRMAEISGAECRSLYHKIDGILGDQQRDEGIATSLTLKASHGLPKQIADGLNRLFRAEFPELHRMGRLRIDFSVLGDINIDNYVYAITVSPSGRFVAGILRSSGGKLIIVWDSRTKVILSKIKAVRALIFILSPHGPENYILVVMEDSLVVWDYSSNACVALLEGSSDINGDDPWLWEADVSKNLLLVWGRNGALLVWETQSYALVYVYCRNAPVVSKETPSFDENFVHISLDEKWLLAHNNLDPSREVSVWDTITWTLHAILPRHKDHYSHYRVTVAFTEGESSIIAACHCGVIHKHDIHTGRLLHNTHLVDSAGNLVHRLDRLITQLSPNGHQVCWAEAVASNQIVNMSDASTGRLRWSVGSRLPYLGVIEGISFSQDGRYVAVRYSDKVLRVWRALNGECVARESLGVAFGFCQFSRNGKVLMVGGIQEPLEAYRTIEL